MKLNYRYTLAYAVVTLFVLSIGFAIVYAAFSRSGTQAAIIKLEHLNAVAAKQLRSNPGYAAAPQANINIRPVAFADSSRPSQTVQLRNEWDATLQAEVSAVRLTTYPVARGQRYRVTSRVALIEPSDINPIGLLLVVAWTLVFLLALVVILSEVVSWHILRPFNDTLRSIQQFQLSQKHNMRLAASGITEFNALNDFLVKMTTRAQSDYQALQEFSENASHELQTPIASIKAKIELLMDSELAEKQFQLLSGMHDELERLAKINQALTLLAKLEHYETPPGTLADFSQLVPATEATFADLAEMKGIRTTQRVAPAVQVPLDASLAQLLLNNLFSNAIRHNLPGGEIRVELSASGLLLENTGAAPTAPVAELFGRFKKGNASLDSIGIGLAIVRRISELYGHRVGYEYAAGWHRVRVDFAG